MEPAVQYLARRGWRRGPATGLVFLGVLVAIAGFVAAMAPLVLSQVRNLATEGPGLISELAALAQGLPGGLGDALAGWLERIETSLPDVLAELAERAGGGLLGLGSTVLGGLFQLLTALLVTFYLVADGPRLRRTLVTRFEGRRQAELLTIWELAIAKTGGYVYSRVVVAASSAIFHGIAFTLLGVPYGAALGLWMGLVASLVPIIGTYLGAALPLLVAVAHRPVTALWVLVLVTMYQQIENYVIAPKTFSRVMALHPAVAFVGVLIGGALLGVAGALLALPAAAVVGALVTTYGEQHEAVDHDLLEEVR